MRLVTLNINLVGLGIVVFLITQCQCAKRLPASAKAQNDSKIAVFEIPWEKEPTRKPKVDLAPRCANFLTNVLYGRWVRNEVPVRIGRRKKKAMMVDMKRREKELDNDMKLVWKKRGLPANPWNSKQKCGYYRLQKEPGRFSPAIGTWCDPNGPRPCCSNMNFGTCVAAHVGGCTCSNCVDVRKLQHAELMKWVPYGFRCKWMEYTPSQACDVIEDSPVKELYLVGDSFMQSMYLGLLQLLTGKPISGSWKKEAFSYAEYSQCGDYGLNYFKECRAMTTSLEQMKYRNALCGDGRNITFKAEFKKYYSWKFGKEFRKFVTDQVGKPGTYIIVGVGWHNQMNLTLTIRNFLNPAVWTVRKYYKNKQYIPVNQRWPQFLFSMPMDYGLLKPTGQLRVHNKNRQITFEQKMRKYCKRHSIEVLDFTPLARNVHTFDGIHYGVGVNYMKNQIFLNYLATLK